jgi:hypothetical protein
MTTGEESTHVTVLLTECAPQDARVVFDALAGRFPAEQEAGEITIGPLENPTVWSATYDAHETGGAQSHLAIAGGVTADISGCPQPVIRLCRALGESFTVEDKGHAAGDQEVEVCLRLTAWHA